MDQPNCTRNELEKREIELLAPYALRSSEPREALEPRFREHDDQTPLEYRTEYHRDRDRILWSRAFKRLQHKTQVFPHYVEDHYRRRLTHSLEVAQIATTLARALDLNEPATEAIALGHDLGHAPFGHAGERALNEVLRAKRPDGAAPETDEPIPIFGFDHCVHGVEVVSRVEREYQIGDNGYFGLNLTFDVRDGILKHMRERRPDDDRPYSNLDRVVPFAAFQEFGNDRGSLEAQCVYFADKVAYLLGDIEDGIRRRIFSCEELTSDDFIKGVWDEHCEKRGQQWLLTLKDVDDFLAYRRKALAALILNCIDTTKQKLADRNIRATEDVASQAQRIVGIGEELNNAWKVFDESWMEGRLYVQKDVMACEFKAKKIIRDLFNAYMKSPDLIDKEYRTNAKECYDAIGLSDEKCVRLVTVRNYIAGMTDPFAMTQHARLFSPLEHVRFS